MAVDITMELSDWDEFQLNWRFRDPRWDLLDQRTISRIHPLSTNSTFELFNLGKSIRGNYPYNLNAELYYAISDFSLNEEIEGQTVKISDWFDSLPIIKDEKVYCLWSRFIPFSAVITDWEVFIINWNTFFYPFDVMTIFDSTREWGLLFGQEEQVVYTRKFESVKI